MIVQARENIQVVLGRFAFAVSLKQLAFVLVVCLVSISLGMLLSDIFVLNYRAELDAGNIEGGSLSALITRLVSTGKIPQQFAWLARPLEPYSPRELVRYLAAGAELFAVLFCSFMPRRFFSFACLGLSALCPLVFVLLTMLWDMFHIPNFCDQFGWHCISHPAQSVAVFVGCTIAVCRAGLTNFDLSSKMDFVLFWAFLALLMMAVTYYNNARGWMMHLG
jgi:hypothetical protein